jgi:Uma2 family endonuclease
MFKTRVNTDEFMKLALSPENLERRFERIDGEIIELVSNDKASEIASIIIGALAGFVYPRKLGRIKGADGGYTIAGDQYIPDCSFVSYQRQPQTATESYPTIAPDLVVEARSPGNSNEEMTRKVVNYLSVGCEVWLVNPVDEKVEVYIAGEAVKTYRNGDTLAGRGALAGFKIEISSIWPR